MDSISLSENLLKGLGFENGRRGRAKDAPAAPWLALGFLLFVAFATLLFFGWYTSASAFLMIELLIAVSALSVGVLLGFLFGLPRSTVGSGEGTTDQTRGIPGLSYRPSTNLEQISDWLTKILIGVGLVELRQIGDALDRMGRAVQESISGVPTFTSTATQIAVVSFMAIGFLASFLWTRIYYGPLQMRTDWGVLKGLEGKLADIKTSLINQASETETVKNVTNMIARGELTAPPVPVVRPTLTEGEIKENVKKWPAAIQQKVKKFEASPKEWTTDPAHDLFPDTPVEASGFKLEGNIAEVMKDVLVVQMCVRSTGEKKLTDMVTFLLHPTLGDPVRHVLPVDGVAEIKFFSEGWFTVVAILNAGETALAYDLRQLPGAPAWFKED